VADCYVQSNDTSFLLAGVKYRLAGQLVLQLLKKNPASCNYLLSYVHSINVKSYVRSYFGHILITKNIRVKMLRVSHNVSYEVTPES
jgi:hypothetical protein